jgi:hypothetical protein
MLEVVQILGERQQNGEPAIYFFGSSNSKKRGDGYGRGTQATWVGSQDYEGRPSYIVANQAMGWAAVYILASALFMLPFFGDELFFVSLLIFFQLELV